MLHQTGFIEMIKKIIKYLLIALSLFGYSVLIAVSIGVGFAFLANLVVGGVFFLSFCIWLVTRNKKAKHFTVWAGTLLLIGITTFFTVLAVWNNIVDKREQSIKPNDTSRIERFNKFDIADTKRLPNNGNSPKPEAISEPPKASIVKEKKYSINSVTPQQVIQKVKLSLSSQGYERFNEFSGTASPTSCVLYDATAGSAATLSTPSVEFSIRVASDTICDRYYGAADDRKTSFTVYFSLIYREPER